MSPDWKERQLIAFEGPRNELRGSFDRAVVGLDGARESDDRAKSEHHLRPACSPSTDRYLHSGWLVGDHGLR